MPKPFQTHNFSAGAFHENIYIYKYIGGDYFDNGALQYCGKANCEFLPSLDSVTGDIRMRLCASNIVAVLPQALQSAAR